MDFKYRAVDDGPTPTAAPPPTKTSFSPRPPSLPTVTYFSEQSLVGGLSSAVPNPIPNTFKMPGNDAGEVLRREMEKAQIRREIIASEVARRLELEEEVRRELALERRGWGITMQRDFGAPPPHGLFSFEERVAMRFRPGVIYAAPKPQLPQLMAHVPLETELSRENNKDKVIVLAKPNPDLFVAKRKAVTPPVVDGSEHPPFGLTKKPKEVWSCALCQVSATSERGLNEHLKGRKHKAKEAALRPQMIGKSTHASVSSTKSKMSVKSTEAIATATSGLGAKADRSSLQLSITGGGIDQTIVEKGVVESKSEEQLVQKSQNTEGLENDGTEIETDHEAARTNALKTKGTKFWCDICQVGAFSRVVMESHKKGRKHFNQMEKKFSPNNGSSLLRSSAPQEAPLLIEDITDQKVTDVLTSEEIVDIAKFC